VEHDSGRACPRTGHRLSDRRAWLDEWCPHCWAAPGSRCRQDRYSSRKRPSPAACLHVARGWRARRCPTCKALPGDPCHTPSGREASHSHAARSRPGRRELAARQAVWEELERRGATVAVVPFAGGAGTGERLERSRLADSRATSSSTSSDGRVATSWRSRSRGCRRKRDRNLALRPDAPADGHREPRASVAVLAMAFSHINLDAPGTPPGRNDPCPCGSGKKTKCCCGVDRSRFLSLRGWHRGVVPVDLAARVDEMAGDFTVRFLARTFLPARLGGLSPRRPDRRGARRVARAVLRPG
jgi:hypothetical protein